MCVCIEGWNWKKKYTFKITKKRPKLTHANFWNPLSWSLGWDWPVEGKSKKQQSKILSKKMLNDETKK